MGKAIMLVRGIMMSSAVISPNSKTLFKSSRSAFSKPVDSRSVEIINCNSSGVTGGRQLCPVYSIPNNRNSQ